MTQEAILESMLFVSRIGVLVGLHQERDPVPERDHPIVSLCAMARLNRRLRQDLLQRDLPHFDPQETIPKQAPEGDPAKGIRLARPADLR